MWSYYGGKTNVVKLYPKPKYDIIIEPFAGSARYALEYFDKEVILIDLYPVIIDIWQYLQNCSPKDILSLPHPKYGSNINDLNISEVEKSFLGFVVGCGANIPRKTVGYRKTIDRPNHINYTLKRISEQLFKIKHWRFSCSDYKEIDNRDATWFIDPPYQFGGEAYKFSNKKIDFKYLAEWSKDRMGQVIVCENTRGNWLNFKPIIKQRGSLYSRTEALWTNENCIYDNIQTKLLM